MANTAAMIPVSPDTVLAAMVTMRGADTGKKKAAMDYLTRFQKSKDAWATIFSILQSDVAPDVHLFAATTLKGKITYDLATQVPETDLPALRDQLLLLLRKFAPGPKPVRVQLCVCLAILALQMRTWTHVLSTVVSSLGDDTAGHAGILDFLRVLPEEVTEGRKINLSEEELTQRTSELLNDNADQVVQLLISYSQSSAEAAQNPQLFECITSWLREVPVGTIVKSPLLDVIVNALSAEQALQAAAECLGTICRETREVDDYLETIQLLLPRVAALRPEIQVAVAGEDGEKFRALTKVFADAGDAWVVLIAREPSHFRPVVDALLECAARDKGRDVIDLTFGFWYELKQFLVLERYQEAKAIYGAVYAQLVDVFLQLLQYPQLEDGDDESDLFEGDREAEEKFREFRHQMGDTLKDACEVLGVSACLSKVLDAIKLWMQQYGGRATATSVPHWQELEAALFAMRAMGRMVNKDEETVLPQLMPLLVQIPPHEKLRFAAVMVLGRYTEWTAEHPEFLEPQFTYIVSSFQTDSKEIVRAAAQSIKFFCLDCKEFLGGQVLQLQTFYDQILDKLPEASQEEVTEGVAVVVAAQQTDDIYRLLKLYCDPLFERLMAKARSATGDEGKLAVADHLQLITIFVQNVVPLTGADKPNPAVKYWEEVFPVLTQVLDNFMDFVPIDERICRCWRAMVLSHRTAITPVLAVMANKLAQGFAASKQGCFLWVTGAILREFSEDREHVQESVTENIYVFFEAQATNVLRAVSELQPADLPDVIEDFFRLLTDALLYYPQKLIPSPLFTPIFEAAVSALALEQRDPLVATLHYLRDMLTYGGDNPATSGDRFGSAGEQTRPIVQQLIISRGEELVKQVMAGMMITFPRDCFPDGSGVLLELFDLFPERTAVWVDSTVRILPEGTVTPVEADRLANKIKERVQTHDAGGLRHVRSLLQDFTNSYRRRYLAPREGLGQLEAARFHFKG